MQRQTKISHAALVAMAALVLAVPSGAATEQPKALVSSGGQRVTGGTVTLDGNVGDAIAGISRPATGFETILEHGFWAGDVHRVLDVPAPMVFRPFGRMWPSPAVEAATFELALPQRVDGSVAIYDPQGRQVRSVVIVSGSQRWTWDLRDDSGELVANGLYLYVATFGVFAAGGNWRSCGDGNAIGRRGMNGSLGSRGFASARRSPTDPQDPHTTGMAL